jgi:Periplasmic copper-binding protein (NosD)
VEDLTMKQTWSMLWLGWLCLVPTVATGAPCGGLTPCGCGDTVVADYTVTADLTCPLSDPFAPALVIGDGVTVSGNSHLLTGTGGGIGVLFDGVHGARVSGLNVTGFDVGVKLRGGASGNVFSDAWVWDHWNGVEVEPGAGEENSIVSVVSAYNQWDGIRLDGSSAQTVAYSFAWSNATSLDLDRATRTTVWASSFWGDMGRAVNLRLAHQNAISFNNFLLGICAIDDTVSDNTFVDNAVTCEVVMVALD